MRHARWGAWMVVGLLALVLGGCSGVRGSGTASTDKRTVGAFSEVEVHGVIELELGLDRPRAVELQGDDNLLALVEAKVHGKRLVLRTTESVRPELPLVAKVAAPDVSGCFAHGASELRLEGVDNERLEIALSGAGKAVAKGHTKRLEVRISGAGEVDAKALRVERAKVRVSGAGSVDVAEPKELEIDISGAGTVRYGGSPSITKRISGAGSIDKR